MGCDSIGSLPAILPLEDSIREIINSKGPAYNFLEDSLYIDKIEGLLSFLDENDHISKDNYLLANLSDDNIPELIVFSEKDPSDKEDTGYISVYAFNGNTYSLLDRVSMNYDVSNYTIKAGYISEDKKGFYLNNMVAGNWGITYGFTLEDNKLVNIFDEKKINLVSSVPENPIDDIDKNGILNFSIVMDNPELNKSDEKILIWYEWDGERGGKKIKVEHYDSNGLIIDKSSDFQKIKELEDQVKNPDNIVFKNMLNNYSNSTSNEYRDYLILKRDYFLNKDSYEIISENIHLNLNNLSEHIIDIEKFLFKYPYSKYTDNLIIYLDFYRSKLLVNQDDFSQEEFNLILIQLENIKNQYSNFYLSSIIDAYMDSYNTIGDMGIEANSIIE